MSQFILELLEFELDPQKKYLTLTNRQLGEMMGLLPTFIHISDDRPAREQFTERYGFGELFDFEGSTIDEDGTYHSKYEEPSEDGPGDPPMAPIAKTKLHDETIWFYPHAMVAIVQPDGSAFVTRMD